MTFVHPGPQVTPGIVMPLGSIVAIDTSPQGAAALAMVGVAHRDDRTDALAATIDALAASTDGGDMAACLGLVADVAARADRWFHLASKGSRLPPSLVLAAPGRCVVCCLHGDVVEWVAGGDDLLAGVVQRAVDATGGRAVTVSVFDRDVCLGSVRFAAGSMDAAARSEEDLAPLTRARDVAEAVHALRSVPVAPDGTP